MKDMMQLTLCPLLLHPGSANAEKALSPLMEPGGRGELSGHKPRCEQYGEVSPVITLFINCPI